MSPYRTSTAPPKAGVARTPRDVALSALVFAVGVLGLVIGLVDGRSFEAGAGTLLALYGAWAVVRALVRRR